MSARVEAGVGDGARHGVDGEVERVAVQPPADVGLADAGDDRVRRRRLACRSSGSKNGSHTSSYCSNSTRTAMPMRTSSGAQPTMSVVSRRPSCSGSSTMATTYGGSRPGYHGWWLTVKVWTSRRPTPPPASSDDPRHCGQTGAGGCTSSRTSGSAGTGARRRRRRSRSAVLVGERGRSRNGCAGPSLLSRPSSSSRSASGAASKPSRAWGSASTAGSRPKPGSVSMIEPTMLVPRRPELPGEHGVALDAGRVAQDHRAHQPDQLVGLAVGGGERVDRRRATRSAPRAAPGTPRAADPRTGSSSRPASLIGSHPSRRAGRRAPCTSLRLVPERDLERHADCDVVRVAVDDVGHHARSLVEVDDRGDVRDALRPTAAGRCGARSSTCRASPARWPPPTRRRRSSSAGRTAGGRSGPAARPAPLDQQPPVPGRVPVRLGLGVGRREVEALLGHRGGIVGCTQWGPTGRCGRQRRSSRRATGPRVGGPTTRSGRSSRRTSTRTPGSRSPCGRTATRSAAPSATCTRWPAASPARLRGAGHRPGRRRRVPAAELGGGRGRVLGDGDARCGRRADRPLLRAQGGRVHPAAVGGAGARDRRPLRPRRPPRDARRARTCRWSTSPWCRRRRDAAPRVRAVRSVGGRSGRTHRPGRRPGRARARRLHVGHDRRPQGRRAHATAASRPRSTSSATSSRRATAPTLVGAPVGHGIGMLAGLLLPVYRGQPIHLIDVWDPAAVLAAMVEDDLTAGSGATFFLLSLLDAPRLRARAPRADAVHRARRRAGAARPSPNGPAALGISIVRAVRLHRAPVDHRGHARPARREADQHRRAADARRGDPAGRRRRRDPGQPARSCRGPVRGLHRPGADRGRRRRRRLVRHRRRRRASTTTAGSRSPTARRTSSSAAARTSAPPRSRNLLVRLPGVAEVAVVAAPDERLGEHACAFVRLTPGADEPTLDAVRAHLEAAGLARQKWPEELHAIADFPRTASGKIQKFVLRDQARARSGEK